VSSFIVVHTFEALDPQHYPPASGPLQNLGSAPSRFIDG
jgi:hypothetical protein